MKVNGELPATGYAVIRCHDRAVVAKFDVSEDGGRALMYYHDGLFSFRPMLENESVFTPTAIVQFLTRNGYRVTPPSDIMISTV